MTTDDNRRAARRSVEPPARRPRQATRPTRPARPVTALHYWVLGMAVLAVALLGGAVLLGRADASPDERPLLLRGLTSGFLFQEWRSSGATPSPRATVPPTAAVLPSQTGPVAAVLPPLAPAVGRRENEGAATSPDPLATRTPLPIDLSVAPSWATKVTVARPSPSTATPTPSTLGAIPAFAAPTALLTKTLVPPTPTLLPPPSPVPTAPPSPSAQRSLAAAAAATPSASSTATLAPSPSAARSLTPAATTTPSPTLAPTLAPTATAVRQDYKLGDEVAITQVLKGFAFTAHWASSPEGVYATDWYPRSATQSCTDSHRMPLAMPVAGKWGLVSQSSPTGGSLYTLIGELDDGNSVAFTHVDRDVLTGRVAANTVVGFVGISGLESFDAAGLKPSHAHTAWNDRLVPGWDGDAGNRPARDFFRQYGFQVELRDPASSATPFTYMLRQSCGGMIGVPPAMTGGYRG